MTINLNTGTIQAPSLPDGQVGLGFSARGQVTVYDDTTPSESVVYPSSVRRLLLVEPKHMMIVTGYNLAKNTKVVFKKVLRSNGIPAQGTADCCPSITLANTIRLHSVELPCWLLDKCNPVFVIKTPGSYEIDVVGDYADVVVTAMAFPMQEVNEFAKCECKEPEPPPPPPVEPPPPPPPVEPPVEPPTEIPPYCDEMNEAYSEEMCSAWRNQREQGDIV